MHHFTTKIFTIHIEEIFAYFSKKYTSKGKSDMCITLPLKQFGASCICINILAT